MAAGKVLAMNRTGGGLSGRIGHRAGYGSNFLMHGKGNSPVLAAWVVVGTIFRNVTYVIFLEAQTANCSRNIFEL